MIHDYFKMAVQSLLHRKMRSWLTMIGIFIGITAVIAIISLGQGLRAAIDDQFAALGNDKIFLQPGTNAMGGSTSVVLDENDRKAVERSPGVVNSVGASYQNARIDFKDEVAYGLVMGVTIDDGGDLWDEMMNQYVDEGRSLTRGDTFKAYLGYDYSQEDRIFSRRVKLGDKITINGQDVQVIGFQKKMGNAADDRQVHISDEAYNRIFKKRLQDEYMVLMIKTAPGVNPAVVAEGVKKELRRERGLDEGEEDFNLQTTEQLLESFTTILLIVQVVIVGIAAISLIVGGVGIMNTMYTAVLERTNDIGVMKAIGAKNSDVLLLFLIESGILGLIGGAIGVICGLTLAKFVELGGTWYFGTPYLRAWWSWPLILGALAFSFIIGAASGITPAWQASKQKPVDSLRYE